MFPLFFAWCIPTSPFIQLNDFYTCITYVGDGYITRSGLKLSNGFKAGPTALNPAGRLAIWPNSLEAGQKAC